jgi:hypothetical protein
MRSKPQFWAFVHVTFNVSYGIQSEFSAAKQGLVSRISVVDEAP